MGSHENPEAQSTRFTANAHRTVTTIMSFGNPSDGNLCMASPFLEAGPSYR